MTKRLTALLASSAPIAFASAPPRQYRAPETAAGATNAATLAEMTDGDEMMKRSPDSAAMLDYWDLTDTLVDGHDAMIKAGEKYLPKFEDETQAEFSARLRFTKYTNVYRDIIESLAAKPFEQEVALIQDENNATPTEIEEFIEDVDGAGNNLTSFASMTFFNAINSAIDWIFVDFPPVNPNIRSIADAKQAGVRPFWSHVLGRNVLKAEVKVINGKETLIYIKIYEPGFPDHIREFERFDNGAVAWRLYAKTDTVVDGKTHFVLVGEGPVTINVIPLVPFATGRRDGRTFRYFPAMRDAADLQRELYQDESGLKFAKTLTAYPMLSGNGVKPMMEADGKNIKPIKTGPKRVLYAPHDGNGRPGSWAFIEPSATSLKFLADDIKETIAQLRELGRQPLTAQSGNLTVITAATAAGKAKSAVASWALGLKDALENSMVITCMWLNISVDAYDPQVNVYTEFDDFMEGKDLDDLNVMRAAGDLSQETLWEEKKRRGVLSAEFDPDVETERLLTEMTKMSEDTANIDGPAPPNPPAPRPGA